MPFNVALETDFLIALAKGADSAAWAVDLFCKAGGRPMVTPSVLQELQDQVDNHQVPDERDAAAIALANLTNWGVLQMGFADLEHQIIVITANKLVGQSHCDDFQTAKIFAEAATLQCTFLLTYRPEMCAKDGTALRLFMQIDCHLTDTFVLSPHQLIEYYRNRDSPDEDASSEPSI